MVTEAKAAFGAVLERDVNTIAELTSIGGVELTLETEDVTSHQSPGAFREKIGTVLDGGSVPLEGNFYPGDTDGQIGLKTDMLAKTVQDFTITLPGIGAIWTFTALVTKFATASMPVDGVLTFSAELEITGVPALTLTASDGLTAPFFAVDVGDDIPNAAGDIYTYAVVIPTINTEIVITPTALAGVITITANDLSQDVISGNASTPIALGAAQTVVECTISVKEVAKTAKVYTLYLTRE